MAEFETVTIAQLPDLVLAINTFLEGDNGNGISGKFTANQLATFLAPYVASSGASSYVATTGSALPSPSSSSAFTFVGPGTYTQTTGGNIVTTAPLNLLSRNSTTWSLTLGLLTNVDLVGNTTNLFDKTSPDIMYNKSLDGAGNIVDFPGAAVSYFIPLTAGVQYVLYGITDGGTRELKFLRSDNTYIGSMIANSYPYTFTAPATTFGMFFTAKIQGGGYDIPDIFLTLASQNRVPAMYSKVGNYNAPKTGQKTVATDLVDDANIKGKPILNIDRLMTAQGVNENLFNPKYVQPNSSLDSNGNVITFGNAAVSEAIFVLQNTYYQLSGVLDNVDRGIVFLNTAFQKIGSIVATSYPFTFKTPGTTAYIKFTAKITDLPLPPKLKLSLPDYGIVKGNSFPYEGAVIDLYGDSVTVDYPIYGELIKAKTKAATVNQRGMSGQSFQFRLQQDANINPMLADKPDIVVVMSVNDHRSDAPIGTPYDTPGAATTAGGLKYIFQKLIANDKDVKIIFCTPITYGDVKEAGYPSSFNSAQPNALGLYKSDYDAVEMNCARQYGIPILDLGTECEFRPTIESFAATRRYTRDGVHPSDTVGFPKLTTIIADKINRNII